MRDIEDVKAMAVRAELDGLDVKYMSHDPRGLTTNMAKVNDYSIIWHEYAYVNDEMNVEVMHDGEVSGYVPISELRKLVTS